MKTVKEVLDNAFELKEHIELHPDLVCLSDLQDGLVEISNLLRALNLEESPTADLEQLVGVMRILADYGREFTKRMENVDPNQLTLADIKKYSLKQQSQ
jgi:hypothetical protein